MALEKGNLHYQGGQGVDTKVEKVEKDSNFAFRWGSFYSNRLAHELLGLGSDGVVRISMVHYNTGEFPCPRSGRE